MTRGRSVVIRLTLSEARAVQRLLEGDKEETGDDDLLDRAAERFTRSLDRHRAIRAQEAS